MFVKLIITRIQCNVHLRKKPKVFVSIVVGLEFGLNNTDEM